MNTTEKQEIKSIRKLIDLMYEGDKEFKVFNFNESMMEDILDLGEKYEMNTLEEKEKYIKLNRKYRYSCNNKLFETLEKQPISNTVNDFDKFIEEQLFDEHYEMKSKIFAEVFATLKSIEKSRAVLIPKDIILKIKEKMSDNEIDIDWRIDLNKQLNKNTLVILKWLYIKYLRER